MNMVGSRKNSSDMMMTVYCLIFLSNSNSAMAMETCLTQVHLGLVLMRPYKQGTTKTTLLRMSLFYIIIERREHISLI